MIERLDDHAQNFWTVEQWRIGVTASVGARASLHDAVLPERRGQGQAPLLHELPWRRGELRRLDERRL